MLTIEGFDLYRLTLPLGRTVGDNNCSYSVINVVAVALHTNHGHTGWGYAESAWQGKFKHDAWYVHQLPELSQLVGDFSGTWWTRLKGRNPFELEEERLGFRSGFPNLDMAARLAIWDLMAKERNVPLYRLLNPEAVLPEAQAYASILDFPLNDREVLDLTQRFIMQGFSIIKIKIGADEVERDVRRIKLIQSYAGPDIRLTADANEAWDWETALDRIETYLRNDIRLEYLEDPLRRDDVKGFAELTKRSPIRIIGHDYVNHIDDLRALVEYGGLQGIRTGKDIDYARNCIRLAEEAGIPVYLGNSMFEINAHLAMAFDRVDRTEYSGLATNDIIADPVRFSNGMIKAPTGPGHGLEPLPMKLTEHSETGMTHIAKP